MIIIFDDWLCFKGDPNKGEQKEFRKLLEKNPLIIASEYIKYRSERTSFILHKKE
ncbi:MAG: hypothetical protein ACFFAT_20770 [Promethearchaeota archaeon]